MSELPDRLQRAFEGHRSFEPRGASAFESVTTVFDGVVEVESTDDSTRFAITVTAPLLGAVTVEEMAPIVEDGWYETFERRVTDVGQIFRTSREVTPTVARDGDQLVVEAAFTDRNPRPRGRRRGRADRLHRGDLRPGNHPRLRVHRTGRQPSPAGSGRRR